jgi:hypothetical protein
MFMAAFLPAYRVVDDHFTAPPGKVGLLYGAHGVYPTATLVAAEIIRRNRPVVFVDAANRVDPYYLAKLARYKGYAPEEFLGRAFVSRAFTCYQFDVAITDGLLEFMQSVGAGVLIVYGPLDLFDDAQVPMADVVDILRRVKQTFDRLKEYHISTMMVSRIPHVQVKGREQLMQPLKAMADVVYRLESYERTQHIIMEKIAYGKNGADSNPLDPARRSKLVEIPDGAQKRGSRYSRQIIPGCQASASRHFYGGAPDSVREYRAFDADRDVPGNPRSPR